MEPRETSELQQLVSSDAENDDSIIQDETEGKIVSPVKSSKVVIHKYNTKKKFLRLRVFNSHYPFLLIIGKILDIILW